MVYLLQESLSQNIWVYLDSRLNFSKHIKEQVLKAMKEVSLVNFLSNYVNRNVLDMSYKAYVRPHHAYGDIFFKGWI